MLLKYSQGEKRTKPNAGNKQQRGTAAMKLSVGLPTARVGRKVMKGTATKRTAIGQQRVTAATRTAERTAVDPCDNSNDSGLGFDHHLELQLRFTDQEPAWASEVKRKKLEIKLESDDANDNFSFPETMSRLTMREEAELSRLNVVRSPARRAVSLPGTTCTSRNGKTQLQIVCQPETQHRARYQTEGSRGAVKDRSGNGFPVVKLSNYNKPATLEVFIGTDVGRVQPHMFYQACRVSGKNSTPCIEKKIEGTVVIEVEFDPAKDYVVTCDCVGILKERNVDVEHRFPHEQQSRNKKKSTRCRMVFRTKIVHSDGSDEWLQITSHPIVCTQPPGVPEICKKSLSSCPCTGGLELFILGKNFLKDTRVLFQQSDGTEPAWEESVQPDKEFLQQTHLVCVVPPYRKTDITESVTVRLAVTSSGKTSEPHTFTYTPVVQPPAAAPALEIPPPCISTVSHAGAMFSGAPATLVLADASAKTTKPSPKKTSQYLSMESASATVTEPEMMWPSADTSKMAAVSGKMMPPPPLLPITARRTSPNVHLVIPEPGLKTELAEDGNSQSPEDVKGIDLRMKPAATTSDLSTTQAPTLATLQRFVTGANDTPLPTQSGPSVEKYLSHLERPPVTDPLFLYGSTAATDCKPQFPAEDISLVPQPRRKSLFEEMNPVAVACSLLMSSGREETEKLDALVNSAAASHMIPVKKMPDYNMMSASSAMLDQVVLTSETRSQETGSETQILVTNSTSHSPPIAMKSIIEPTNPTIDNISEQHHTQPIAVKTMIEPIAMKNMLEQADPLHTIEQPNPRHTAPIAVKTMIEQTDPHHTSPIAMKTMIEQSDSCHTSPIAMKTIINQSDPCHTSPIAMKTIINQSDPCHTTPIAMKTMMNQSDPCHTTPIAMKTLMNQANPHHTSAIAMKSMIDEPDLAMPGSLALNSPHVTTVTAEGAQLTSFVQSGSVDNGRLNALVQSTLSGQQQAMLASTAHVSVESARLNALAQQAMRQQPDSLTQSLLEPSVVKSGAGKVGDTSQLNSLLSGRNQQTSLVSSSGVSEESTRLSTLTQSLLFPPQQKTDKMQPPQKKSEEGMVPQELAQMSEHDLLSYINPNAFDQGEYSGALHFEI